MKLLIMMGLVLLSGLSAFADDFVPLTMNFHSTKNFNNYQYDKLMQAKQLVEMIINSPAFKSRVLGFTYSGNRVFVQNNGMSNSQIYEYLMNGAERFPQQTEVDHEMDYDLVLYRPKWYQSKNVLGYTSQDTNIIHINRNFFNDAEVNQIAMNLVHEWTHKMGFGHDYKRTSRRPYSVPYGIGYIVRDLGNKMFGMTFTEDSDFH
jgi:hypothetical protein